MPALISVPATVMVTSVPIMTTSPWAKIDQAHDAVHHRVAQRDQRVDAALDQAIDDLLEENIHFVSVDRSIRKRHLAVPFLLANLVTSSRLLPWWLQPRL
jgi:hypothetical protein